MSIERGAGPNTRTPASLYVEPWHGQRNQPPYVCAVARVLARECRRYGTVQPRCTHLW